MTTPSLWTRPSTPREATLWTFWSRLLVVDDAINEVGRLFEFTDRVHQAMVNQILLTHALKTVMGAEPELMRDELSLLDPDQVYFYGISQGHILSGTYLALAPEIDRGVLGVGGGALGMMLTRATAFNAIRLLLGPPLRTALAVQELAALSQTTLDRIDPVTYAPWVLEPGEAPFAQSPPGRRLLMQVGLGDAAVPNLGSWYHARALGLPLLDPTPEGVFGLESVNGPQPSALVLFDYGIPEPRPGTIANLDWPSNEVHEGVRRTEAGQRQIDRFLQPDAQIESTCDGTCDPE